jgi:nucleoside-diphosphate-sugar epimerase
MTEKILVTGAAGNIGAALVKKLLENENSFVVAVDNLSTGHINNLPLNNHKNFKFIKCDINEYLDISSIMTLHRFDNVFHYAAVVGVERTIHNPIMVLRDIDGFKNILTLSKNTGVKRVLFSSSSEVYGEPVEFPQHEETTPLNSRLTYAVVKNVGESFLKAYQREYGLDYTIFRFFNTFGPNQTSDFVIPRFIYAALENKDITIYGDGNQTRTFCYIDDNIEATIKILRSGSYINDIVNIGNDVETSIIDLANVIIRITGSRSKIVFLPPLKEGDMQRRKPDNSKMRKILKRELISIEDGIRRTVEDIKEKNSFASDKVIYQTM